MNSFKWSKNSCYLDTVMWVLFFNPCPFFHKHFLKINMPNISFFNKNRIDLEERFQLELKTHLRQLSKKFSQSKPISNDSFRNWFKKWQHHPNCSSLKNWISFHLDEMNEAQEFLQFLLATQGMNGRDVFGTIVSETIFYGKPWTQVKKRKDEKASLIWNLPINQYSPSNLLRKIEEHEGMHIIYKNKRYPFVKTVWEVEKLGDFFVLSVERIDQNGKVCFDPFYYTEDLKDKRKKVLYLKGVIVFDGDEIAGHYTAYVKKKKDQWWFYDDLDLPVKLIKEDLSNIFQTKGVLFFFHLSC